jgi:hypothetical protein
VGECAGEDDHADRPGFALGAAGGDQLQLGIVGYQFPDASDPRKRYSWYVLGGSATASGQSWEFQWQALTCDDAPLISDWFRQLASWASEPAGVSAPDAPWLIEPNLQFRSPSKRAGLVQLVVELDLEFLPPERRSGRAGAGRPEVLTLMVTPDELMDAADDFEATIERFPGG